MYLIRHPETFFTHIVSGNEKQTICERYHFDDLNKIKRDGTLAMVDCTWCLKLMPSLRTEMITSQDQMYVTVNGHYIIKDPFALCGENVSEMALTKITEHSLERATCPTCIGRLKW